MNSKYSNVYVGAYNIILMWTCDATQIHLLSPHQLHKLGVLPFEEKLGESTLRHYQEMWANNGDILSRQYTGTRAMKVVHVHLGQVVVLSSESAKQSIF